jgi:hypothetical protein
VGGICDLVYREKRRQPIEGLRESVDERTLLGGVKSGWIPAFAGMTEILVIISAVYDASADCRIGVQKDRRPSSSSLL